VDVCPPPERRAGVEKTWNLKAVTAGWIPSPGRSVVKISAQHATITLAAPTQGLPASASALASSVFLKNETCDPSHLCISATMGLVMPTRLKGVKGHP